jgi:signal transduction histidine kinase/CheY-like chemotaxis protein
MSLTLQEFLQQQGYALCEYLGDGEFCLLAEPPAWFAEIWHLPETEKKPLRLGDDSPFLEGFLTEAEAFWQSRAAGVLPSGAWIERSHGDLGAICEIPLEALALTIGDKRVLSIQSQPEAFLERTRVLQTARDALLVHERLRKEVQKKEILLHCIIHDLSQPLTAMRGCFEILGLEEGSPRIKQLVEVGMQQSEQQEEMIREVLKAFSADLQEGIEPGGATAVLPNVLTCARETVTAFAPTFEAKGITLWLDPRLRSRSGWPVIGEYTRLKRIFSNLVENALRYAPSGSVVTIGIEEEGRFLKAYVEDQGPGFAKGFQAADAFKLFAKGKEGGGKAGLGLYFCRITVERWGGTIGCEAVVPKGARFWFRLLAGKEQSITKRDGENLQRDVATREGSELAADATKVPGTTKVPGASKAVGATKVMGTTGGMDARLRESESHWEGVAPVDAELLPPTPPASLEVLLADDDSAIRELTELLLTRQGHKVVAVDNGQDVLRVLSSRRFDVVLLDDEMPGLNGAETARRIRAAEQGGDKHQFLLSLSGNNTEADQRRLLQAGVDACLSKPFHFEDLNKAMARLVFPVPEAAKAFSALNAARDTAGDVRADLLQRVGGDAELLRRMIKIFLKDHPKKMALLRQALARKDAAALAATAHALKGSVSIFGAAEARQFAEELQDMGRQGQISGAAERLKLLEEQIVILEKKLRGYTREASRTGSPSGKGKAGVRRRQKRIKR